jgi:hypothetical protein
MHRIRNGIQLVISVRGQQISQTVLCENSHITYSFYYFQPHVAVRNVRVLKTLCCVSIGSADSLSGLHLFMVLFKCFFSTAQVMHHLVKRDNLYDCIRWWQRSGDSENMLHKSLELHIASHKIADSGNMLHIFAESENVLHNIPVLVRVNVNTFSQF